MPPSKGVPSGPWISASQRKMSSSETGPAVMPSGGEEVRSLYSWKRRRDAIVDAMPGGVWIRRGKKVGRCGGSVEGARSDDRGYTTVQGASAFPLYYNTGLRFLAHSSKGIEISGGEEPKHSSFVHPTFTRRRGIIHPLQHRR